MSDDRIAIAPVWAVAVGILFQIGLGPYLGERGHATEPSAGPLSPELLAHYGETVADALARYREYPRSARVWGWQGVVTMQLRVAPSGRLLEAQVRTSSGHEVLDREAIAMAWRPERLPPLPAGVRDQEVTVLVPIVFRLTRP
jgi:protein TonB